VNLWSRAIVQGAVRSRRDVCHTCSLLCPLRGAPYHPPRFAVLAS
jgi:hypothetical protein